MCHVPSTLPNLLNCSLLFGLAPFSPNLGSALVMCFIILVRETSYNTQCKAFLMIYLVGKEVAHDFI